MAVEDRKISPRVLMLGAFGGTSVLNYAFGFAMGWLLTPGDYGLLAFAQTLLLIGGLVLQSGFSWSLARDVVNAEQSPERDALVRGALLANLVVSLALGAGLIALFAAGPLRAGFERWPMVLIVALCLPLISTMSTARGVAQGSDRFGIVASVGLSEVSIKALSGFGLALLGLGVTGAFAGFLLGATFAAVLGMWRITRGLGVRLWGWVKLPDPRASGAIFGALLGLSLLLNLDLAALKILSEDRATAGFYQAGLVLSNAPYYLVASAMLPVLFVQLARQETLHETRRTLGETLGLTMALVVPFEVILMVLPGHALETFFPDAYVRGAETLRLLAAGNILLILAATLSSAFQAVGRARVPSVILLILVVAEPLVLWKTIPVYQEMGAAWVFLAATALAFLALAALYLKEAGACCLREVAPWLVRYLLSGVAGFVVGCLVYGAELGVDVAAVSGVTGYLAAATALRIIHPLEIVPGGDQLFRKLAFSRKE